MDIINQMISWVEQNWGNVMFGTVSLGTAVTTAILLFKQFISNKAQGTKYETMWNNAQGMISQLKTAYDQEKVKNVGVEKEKVFLQASQTVLMDAVIKMALASKLDSDDKAAIVANVERLKIMAPTEIIKEAKETSENVVTNVVQELNDNPAQTVVNITNSVGSLLDKYNTKNG